MFYINYVEYKLSRAKTINNITSGFTLTMWNINDEEILSMIDVASFTLTMWNINMINGAFDVIVDTFYINYVEYKQF